MATRGGETIIISRTPSLRMLVYLSATFRRLGLSEERSYDTQHDSYSMNTVLFYFTIRILFSSMVKPEQFLPQIDPYPQCLNAPRHFSTCTGKKNRLQLR